MMTKTKLTNLNNLPHQKRIADDGQTLVERLVRLTDDLNRIKGAAFPQALKSPSFASWVDDDYIYLETSLQGDAELEADLCVFANSITIRVRRTGSVEGN